MNTERLSTLAEFLGAFRPSEKAQFNLGLWWDETDCGYVACAIGHSVELFREQGLRLTDGGIWPANPAYKGITGWSAVVAFFDLPSMKDAWILFDSAFYPPNASAADVAARIRKYVNGQHRKLAETRGVPTSDET